MKEELASKSQTNNCIYMDNAATTPVDSEVIKDMMPFLFEHYGNPSSLHSMGRQTTLAISKSRIRIAKLINAEPTEIYFTSGGTESNNLAIIGIAKSIKRHKPKCNRLLTSEIEHESILETVKYVQNDLGFIIDYVPSTKEGFIDVVSFKEMITKETGIVTIMMVNNEIGTIQPIRELVNHAKNVNKEIVFHSDSVQALGKIPIDVKELGINMLSLSSHKINGPKGIGALYLKKRTVIEPILYGGGQEVRLRSGTENVASIVGFGKACELYRGKIRSHDSHLRQLQKYFIERIDNEIPGAKINGSLENRISNNLNFSFKGINGENLLIKLDEMGLKVSTGSACSSNRKKRASHVLESIGLSYSEISSSIRFSLGIQNSKEEIDMAIEILKEAILDIKITK